ncbi:MAG TPA: hypothetical protein VF504_07130, partial [Solirubrobacterales bacterium]
PGSTYCGLPQHQSLSRFETSQTAVLADLSEAEVAILADPDADEGQVEEIVARATANFTEPSEDEVPEPSEDEVATEEAIEEDIAEEAREAEEVDGETLDDDPEAAEDLPAEEAPAEQAEEVVEEAEQA